MSLPSSGNETFDSLAALSVILDLANGFTEDKSLLTAVLAQQLAVAQGLDADTRWSALLAALVRHLGCTAFAPVEATLATDDIALRGHLQRSDPRNQGEVVRAILRANTRAAPQLELGPAVERALDEVFEQYDGRGAPQGLVGDAISLVGRIAHVAHEAVLVWLDTGVVAARTALLAHPGLDPVLAWATAQLLDGAPGDFLERHHPEVLALARTRGLVPLTTLAAAFGDFADLQLPDGVGHSREVARRVTRAAAQLGFTSQETHEVVLAAHLHDLGMVALPTSLWLTPRAFRAGERERAHAHASFTERVLLAAAPLAHVARIAGAHHQRLDGARDASQPRTARLLAAADVWVALQSNRPHRKALPHHEAIAALRAERLDPTCVEALLNERAAAPARTALTERELEVLRLLSRGLTNKEIAQALDISARTVQHHTIHVYEKLGVDTRAGATLEATAAGLLA
jgi:response regulator RpfG family c-di-GMP phosphodiesterase